MGSGQTARFPHTGWARAPAAVRQLGCLISLGALGTEDSGGRCGVCGQGRSWAMGAEASGRLHSCWPFIESQAIQVPVLLWDRQEPKRSFPE